MAATALRDGLDVRILDASLRCVSRWGLTKTTLDDIAREAGCSRATIYRTFPGGRDSLLATAVRRDIAGFFARLGDHLDGAGDLEDMLVTALTEASGWVSDHEVFQYLLAHEPEVVLPHLAFRRLDRLFRLVVSHAAPHLGRFLDDEVAARVAEWLTRLVLSFTLTPSEQVDLRDPADARRLVRQYLLPGIAVAPRPPANPRS